MLIWVAVSAGMVVANQFGMTSVELQVASHLSRLGMLGLSVLLVIYAYWAFFPSSKLLFWAIVVVPLLLHGCLWIAVRFLSMFCLFDVPEIFGTDC